MTGRTPYRLQSGVLIAVPLPAGYSRVWTGGVQIGDFYLDCVRVQKGDVVWARVSFADVLQKPRYDDRAELYGCLIRQTAGGEVGRPCPRCRSEAPVLGLRLCGTCEGF